MKKSSKPSNPQMADMVPAINLSLSHMGYSITITYTDIQKNNGVVMAAYEVQSPRCKIRPMIYDCPQIWTDSPDDIAAYIISVYKRAEDSPCETEVKRLIDPDYVLANVYPMAVAADNKDNLCGRKIPYLRVADLCINFYIKMDSKFDDRTATISITQPLLDMLRLPLHEIADQAYKNIANDIHVYSLSQILGIDSFEVPGLPIYVVTNSDKLRGAGALASPYAISKICDRIGRDLIILPSSIHELICFRSGTGYDDFQILKSMVYEINRNEVLDMDRLTDSVYIIKNSILQTVI